MNHLWWGKVFTKLGLGDIGGAQLMLVPPPKNPGWPSFGVGMPHAWSGGDALTCLTSAKAS